MKIWVIAVIFLFLMPFSHGKSETVVIEKGESLVIENINITLVDYSKKKEKLLVCVNNQRAILSDDKRIGSVYFDLKIFRNNGVKVELDADCDDCVVSDNSKCFPAKNLTEKESDFDFEDELDNEENETDLNENTKESTNSYSGILKRVISFISSWLVAGK